MSIFKNLSLDNLNLRVLFCSILAISLAHISIAQKELIILSNGKEIPANILSIGQKEVKYQLSNDSDSTFSQNSKDVFMIVRPNGTYQIITPIKQVSLSLENPKLLSRIGRFVYIDRVRSKERQLDSLLSNVGKGELKPLLIKGLHQANQSNYFIIGGASVFAISAFILIRNILLYNQAADVINFAKNNYMKHDLVVPYEQQLKSSSQVIDVTTPLTAIGFGSFTYGIVLNLSGKHKLDNVIGKYNATIH